MLKPLALILTASVLAGCAGSAPGPATPKTFANYNEQANNGQRLSLEGYVRLPAATLVSDTMMLELHEQPDSDKPQISFSIPIGGGANQVEQPPKDYQASDLKVRDKTGALIAPDQKVRISGKLIYSPSSSILYPPIELEKL